MKIVSLIVLTSLFYITSLYACDSWDCSESIDICSSETLDACNVDSSITTDNSSYDNLAIYLGEVYGETADITEGASETTASAENFQLILDESKPTAEEKEELLSRFQKLQRYTPQRERELQTSEGKNTPETFLRALDLFYGEKFQESYELLNKMATNASGFSAEYSLYLSTRAAHRMALFNWDGYSNFQESLDRSWVEKMDAAAKKYQERYPSGKYFTTLENMKRRIAVLKNGPSAFFPLINAAIDDALSQKISIPAKKRRMNELLMEYIYVTSRTAAAFEDSVQIHPTYWPVFSQYILRDSLQTPKEKIQLLETKLDSQKESFNNYPLEWAFAKGAFLYYKQDYESLITLLTNYQSKTYSTESLKARALIKLRKFEEAKKILLPIKNYELLFFTYYYNNELENAFLSSSGIPFDARFAEAAVKKLESTRLVNLVKNKKILAQYIPLLEEAITQKALLKSDWPSLSQFKSKMYPSLQASAKKLISDSENQSSLINVIKAQTSSNLSYYNLFNNCLGDDLNTDKVDLKELKIPVHYIEKVLSHLKPSQSYSFEPMLLSQAINCFKGSGENCSMGFYLGDENFGKAFPPQTREAWFKRLHRKYKKSSYAKKTKYYY